MRIEHFSFPSWKSLAAVAAAGVLTLALVAPASAQTNQAPTPQNDAVTTTEDTAIDIDALANDTDPEGNTLSVAAVGVAAHGTATINGDGTLKYTPAANYHGTDSFTYAVTDGALVSSATVTMTVTPVNDAPVATDDTYDVTKNTPKAMDVRANDTDVDGDTLTIVSTTAPAHGTVAIGDSKVTYTPIEGYVGADVFTYTITDGSLTASASVAVTVKEPTTPTTDFDAKVVAACQTGAAQPGVTALCGIYLTGNLPAWAEYHVGKNILKLAVTTPKHDEKVTAVCAATTEGVVSQLCAVYSAGNLPVFAQERVGKLILKIEAKATSPAIKDHQKSDKDHKESKSSKDKASKNKSGSQSISDSGDDDDDHDGKSRHGRDGRWGRDHR
ncbi:MAG: cadherin-like domain-containing protein [Dehalococcoidia bacterium]